MRTRHPRRTIPWFPLLLLGVGVGSVAHLGCPGRFDGGVCISKEEISTSTDALLSKVEKTNAELRKLAVLLDEGTDKLSKKEFPADLPDKLGALFHGDLYSIDGSQVATLDPRTFGLLMSYIDGVDDISRDMQRLRTHLDLARPAMEKHWREEKEPVFGYSVTFRAPASGTGDVVAELVPMKDPFAVSRDWPGKFTVKKREGDKIVDRTVTRYVKDRPLDDSVAVPIDPSTTAFLFEQVERRLLSVFHDMRTTLKGDPDALSSPFPLFEKGDRLVEALKRGN